MRNGDLIYIREGVFYYTNNNSVVGLEDNECTGVVYHTLDHKRSLNISTDDLEKIRSTLPLAIAKYRKDYSNAPDKVVYGELTSVELGSDDCVIGNITYDSGNTSEGVSLYLVYPLGVFIGMNDAGVVEHCNRLANKEV